MVSFIGIPQIQHQNALINTEPLGNALQEMGTVRRQNALLEETRRRADDQQAYQRGRDAKADARQADADRQAQVDRIGKMALMYDRITEPRLRQAGLDKILKMHPGAAGLGPEYRDPTSAFKLIAAEAGQWRDPREDQAADLDLEMKRAQIEKVRRDMTKPFGGNAPSNVQEWEYYNRLSPEDQQRYLTMKRAEKWLDRGTEFVAPNPIDPTAPPRVLEKNTDEAKYRDTLAKGRAEAAGNLPTAEMASQRALDTIEAIRSHPGRELGLGAAGILPGIPGTVQKAFVNLVDQAKGQAFLEAFNSLRGGGQITEAEGRKATDALARLDRAQRPEDFDAALKDYENVIKKGLDAARQRAGANSGNPPPPNGGRPDPLGLFGGD